MADHLSENPRDWPGDPFRLLGVGSDATEADIKRAYTRLIRRFKPEHAPEQFRRVRDAYESALEQTRWRGFVAPEFTPTESTDPSPSAELRSPNLAEDQPSRSAPLDPEDEAWSLAVAGNLAPAYERLVELSRARPDARIVPVRLYWLLAVHPALDSNRTRHDWLGEALRHGRLTGPSVELYRRELYADSEAGFSLPYLRILETNADPGPLLWLAGQRIGPAGIDRVWKVLDIDFAALAERADELDESAWLSYLVNVMGLLEYEYPAPTYARCSRLLNGLRHLELRHPWAFDQLDELAARNRALAEAETLPVSVVDVLRDAWSGQPGMWHRALRRAAAWVAVNPVSALNELDRASYQFGGRTLLTAFARLLDECPQPSVVYPPGVIRGLVTEFLSKIRGPYPQMRPALLEFLIAEAIDPHELVQACVVDARPMSRSLVEHVLDDFVLRIVWLTMTAGGAL